MNSIKLNLCILALLQIPLVAMEENHHNQGPVGISLLSVKENFNQPGIIEEATKQLNQAIVDIATHHAPRPVKKVIRKLKSSQPLTKQILSILTGAGVGKTTLARAIAQKGHARSKIIHVGCMGSSYLFSQQEHLLEAIAPLGKKKNRWVVILDNIDCLNHYTKVFNLQSSDTCQYAYDNDTVVEHDPLEQLDHYYGKKAYHVISPARVLCDLLDLFKKNKVNNVAFIGTARNPENIPDFVKKRFNTIEIPLPNETLRRDVIQYGLRHMPSETTSRRLAKHFSSRTQGHNQFDLHHLCNRICNNYNSNNHLSDTQAIADIQSEFLNHSWYKNAKQILSENKVLSTSISLNAILFSYICYRYIPFRRLSEKFRKWTLLQTKKTRQLFYRKCGLK